MKCPECGTEMNREEILVNRTTSPLQDDNFQDGWRCPKCGYIELDPK